MKKLIKKCPVFLMIISVGVLLTLLAIGGRGNIYATQEYHPVKEPLLEMVLKGIQEGNYPWQIFDASARETMQQAKDEIEQMKQNSAPEGGRDPEVVAEPAATPTKEPRATKSPVLLPTPSPTPKFPQGRLAPLRESTYEEYINHISADIYGDMGVQRAADYSFVQVEESYFDDALFIGDSRTVGLRDYTDLSEHADFLCETSLTIYKVMEEKFKGMGTVEAVLSQKDYRKIYLMVGINELGRGTTEDFMEKYTEVVDKLHELEPEAKIIIQANMKVSGEKSSSDAIFNNENIISRNHAIATLADNETFFYIDMNEAVCDDNGDLNAEYTHDQIHLLGKYNELWKQFLMTHGVRE